MSVNETNIAVQSLGQPPPNYTSRPVALASFPRSGNSLMRSLIEKFTCFYTGSDNQNITLLSQDLMNMGLKGEGRVQDVWIVKTHFPERRSRADKIFTARKVILLCRNPFDVLDSYFNMIMTGEHTKNVEENVYTMMTSEFTTLMRSEIKVWTRYIYTVALKIADVGSQHHFHCTDLAINTQEKVMIACFEDSIHFGSMLHEVAKTTLLMNITAMFNSRKTLLQLEEFLSQGTATRTERDVFRERIAAMTSDNAIQSGHAGVYRPRSQPKLFKSLHHFDDTLRVQLLFEAKSILVQLGYSELLMKSPLCETWSRVVRRLRKPVALFESEICKHQACNGVCVNGTPSIRVSAANKHGRGFDWKFNFFEKYNFASAEIALQWARKYLHRQIGQKLALRKDMSRITAMLDSYGLTVSNVLQSQNIDNHDTPNCPTEEKRKNGERAPQGRQRQGCVGNIKATDS